MKIKDFLGSTVLDKNANVVGKVENVDFDTESGSITDLTLSLQKNIFSHDALDIKFEDIQTIGAYVILNKEITREESEEKEVEAEIENE